ncbi:HNH endonuclease signature motif containing protein [Nocardioides zeae]|uniref:DUF222 domain-containing protein n=1 Tax=Nocardioides zeae TaxID=1457234 RepID=A0A6P0HPC8_9ACTN|nr:HNH endonuclease signature motif containing protein [Nocardioides zeae]NEN80552.1 DUF222 domain-containing protein [Nocardioides zeae]
MTGVSSSGDAGGGEPPVPDWLEHAFATGEWPAEADNSYSTVFVPPGRHDEVPPPAAVEPAGWAAPGVPVDVGGDVDHPVVAAIGGASGALTFDGLDWMSAADAGAGLVAVQRLVARASALAAVLLARAEELEVHRENGASTAAVWWANATALTRRDAYRFARVGDAITGRCGTHLATGCAAGAVNVEQADVIVSALDELPGDLPVELRLEAEETLVGFAADHDARALRAIGKKILTVIAPEVGEAHEAAVLEKEEREARAASRLTMVSDGRGRVHGRFTLPELHGAMLRKALDAYAAPQHLNSSDDPEQRFRRERPTPERYGLAFQQLLEMLDQKDLPAAGGTGATVLVTMTLESLLGGLATASLDTGGAISAGEARRLACGARIIPAVLGAKSEVLDLGRTARFHTRAMRTAMAIRDGGCVAEGCDRPPHQTQAHHLTAWARGGATNVEDGCLLCDQHHRQVHDPLYLVERLGTGKLRFIRRE